MVFYSRRPYFEDLTDYSRSGVVNYFTNGILIVNKFCYFKILKKFCDVSVSDHEMGKPTSNMIRHDPELRDLYNTALS